MSGFYGSEPVHRSDAGARSRKIARRVAWTLVAATGIVVLLLF